MNTVNLIEEPMIGFSQSKDDALLLLKVLLFLEQQSVSDLNMYTRELLQEEATEIAEEFDVPLNYVVDSLCRLGDSFDIFSRNIYPAINFNDVIVIKKLNGVRALIENPLLTDAQAMMLLDSTFAVVNTIRCYTSAFHRTDIIVRSAV